MKSAFFHQRRLLTGATFHMVKRREPGTRLEGLDFCGGITIILNDHNASIVKGSLEVKLPTIWRDEKQRREE